MPENRSDLRLSAPQFTFKKSKNKTKSNGDINLGLNFDNVMII